MGMELGKFGSDDFTVEVPYGAPESGAFVTLRYVSIKKAREIKAKATKNDFHPGTHQPRATLDEDKFSRLWGEWSVVGWRGLDQDGIEYPFTPENRDAAMTGQRKFQAFVFDLSDDIERLTQIEREKVRGN